MGEVLVFLAWQESLLLSYASVSPVLGLDFGLLLLRYVLLKSPFSSDDYGLQQNIGSTPR